MNQHARIDMQPVPFIDLAAQRRRLGKKIDEAIARVTEHCPFILGPEVTALEKELAAFGGAKHAISCASGTDALVLVLMAKNIGPGDAVICPSFTFCATAEVVVLLGATPVFADVDPGHLQHQHRECARRPLRRRKALGLKPKAIVPVDLFGLPADHDAIAERWPRRKTCSCSTTPRRTFGADCKGKRIGTLRPCDRDQLLSGQAARLLRRRRRGPDRRRRTERHHQEPARAWAGHRQIRQRPDRSRPAGSTPCRPRSCSRS